MLPKVHKLQKISSHRLDCLSLLDSIFVWICFRSLKVEKTRRDDVITEKKIMQSRIYSLHAKYINIQLSCTTNMSFWPCHHNIDQFLTKLKSRWWVKWCKWCKRCKMCRKTYLSSIISMDILSIIMVSMVPWKKDLYHNNNNDDFRRNVNNFINKSKNIQQHSWH